MSVNSIENLVRNCVLAQMAPYVEQFRIIKNQLDAQQQANSIKNSEQIRQENSMLKASLALIQEKYNENVNYSIMKCQRKIEHLCDDIKNIQIKMANYQPHNDERNNKNIQIPSYRSEQNIRVGVAQSPPNYPPTLDFYQENIQRQKQNSGIRKSEKIFRYQMDNPHNQRFQIDSQLNRIKVTYAQEWDGHCYNFIKSGDIPYNQNAKFNLRQTKTVSRYVMTGIGTQKIFGMKDAHKSKECIAYFSANGNIWNQGTCTVGGRPINDGELISVSVQRSRGLISWIVGSRALATTQLPASFAQQQLYWIVLLVHQNDTVEILLD